MPRMQLDKDQKINILLVELQQRYIASHNIRERSLKFTLWLSGIGLGLAWFLLSPKTILLLSQRIALTILIVTIFSGAILFILGLDRGFKNNRLTMIACEKALNLYEPGIFLDDQSLLPSEYVNCDTKWGHHFNTLYIFLILILSPLLVLLWI